MGKVGYGKKSDMGMGKVWYGESLVWEKSGMGKVGYGKSRFGKSRYGKSPVGKVGMGNVRVPSVLDT